MATANLTDVADIFPDGTSVGAYLRTQWPVEGLAGAPTGSAITTATVSNGALKFTGLNAGQRYVAYAQVNSKDLTRRFTTDGGPVYSVWQPSLSNLLATNMDPLLVSGSSSLDAVDTQHFMRIDIPQVVTVSNFVVYVNSTATLTANHCWGSLYASSGALIAQTADQSGVGGWGTTGVRSAALTAQAGQSLTLQPGWVYAAIQFAGTTLTVGRAVQPFTAALLNYNLAATDGYRAATGPGSTTTPPATVPTLTIGAKPFWVALT